ncbi:MAG: hypothetical protein RIE53_03480 [Rhodothermales bacterium]
MYRPPATALFLILATLLSTGCSDDPSNVGIGLVDAQAGDALVETHDAVTFAADGPADITGGDITTGATRALAGLVDDPRIGVFTANGFVDFVPSGTFPASFTSGTVSYVELLLDIDYVHGDTTRTLGMDVSDISTAWTSVGRRADTTLTVGSPIQAFDVNPISRTVRVVMPDEWVAVNGAVLRSTTFQDDFHGFRIRGLSGNAVVGFNLVNSRMRASAVAGDTVSFAMSKVLTTLPADPTGGPAGAVVLQDAGRNTVTLKFPDLPSMAVHQAVVRAQVYTPQAEDPQGFARPVPPAIGLRAVTADNSVRLPLLTVQAAEDGSVVFEDPIITRIMQQAVLGLSEFDRFELYIPTGSSTVGSLSLTGGPSAGGGPRLIVTHTPLD